MTSLEMEYTEEELREIESKEWVNLCEDGLYKSE